MIGNIPIPQGPILKFVRNKYQGDGHEAKKQLIEETADLSNKIVASYIFYIEEPSKVTDKQREAFSDDIESYGKRAVEVMNFADQSNTSNVTEEQLDTMKNVQKLLADDKEEKQNTPEEILDSSLKKLGVEDVEIEIDPKETVDSFFNKIDNELYVQYYAILDYIIDQCVSFATDRDIKPRKFRNLKTYNQIAISRM